MSAYRRIAFSTNAFKKTSLREAIVAIGEIGYAGCEIMADQPHLTPSNLSSGDVEELSGWLEEAGLVVSNVNAFTGFFAGGEGPTGDTYHPTWLEEDEERRRMRIEHTRSSIRLAAALGARTVSLQPGGPLIGTGISRHQAEERFAAGVEACLPMAREVEVVLAIEPEPGLLLQTSGEYLEWKRRHFPRERLVRMNFDVGHAFCVGEDPAEVARKLAGEYAHVHLEDIAESRVHQHLAPGEGAIDFPGLFEALAAAGYDGWVTVELYPFMDDPRGVAERALNHLRELGIAK